jgi:CHAD domain-containing protein
VAYRLESNERVPQGIKRIVNEEIDAAVRQLSGQSAPARDEAIHEARKNVKKIRGVLRLMQPEMGEIYPLENALFRDIGRHLSQFRDAGAIIETFDALRKKYRADWNGRSLAPVRRRLVARKAQAEKQANIEEVLSSMAAALSLSLARINGWPLSQDGFPAIAPGLTATFRRGQKAMARARKHPRPENYHEWRKRVKDHWYHTRLLQGLWNREIEEYEKNLKELETALGEGHNLVVLREAVLAESASYGQNPDIRLLERAIEKYRQQLQDEALELGKRIYEEKPGRFTRRIQRLWDDWQSKDGRPKAAVSAPE